jgi:hypothetical protein
MRRTGLAGQRWRLLHAGDDRVIEGSTLCTLSALALCQSDDLQNIPWHREIVAAWARHTQAGPR